MLVVIIAYVSILDFTDFQIFVFFKLRILHFISSLNETKLVKIIIRFIVLVRL